MYRSPGVQHTLFSALVISTPNNEHTLYLAHFVLSTACNEHTPHLTPVSCAANSLTVSPRPRKLFTHLFTHIYSPHQVIFSTLLTHLGYRLTLSGIKATGIEWGVSINRLHLHYLFNIKSSMHTGICYVTSRKTL